jgi:tetratricopeptide (TPR) repeat protein
MAQAMEAEVPSEEVADTPQARLYAAIEEYKDGKYERVIPKLEAVIEDEPTLLLAWETLGWAYWQTGRPDKSKELWEQLVAIAPNEPMGYNLLGQVATRNGDDAKAAELYKQSLALNPAQFEIRLSYARATLRSGNRAEAIAGFKRLYEEEPQRTDVQIDLAWALFENEEYEDSLDLWNIINESNPGNPDYLLARANVRLLVGQLDEAEVDAKRVLVEEPENVDAIHILVTLSIRTDRPLETVERLEKVLELAETQRTKVNVAQQIALYKQTIYGKNPEIFSLKDVVLAGKDTWELDTENIGSALFYAEALVLDKQYASAEDVFTYVLEELNPNNERARYGLFETYMGRARYEDAERQLRENLRNFNEQNPYRHLYWARLHFAKGDLTEALRSLDRLEYEGAQGAVFNLAYQGVSLSEWSDSPSVRQLREQLMALRRDGFTFITPSQLPLYFKNKQPPPLVDDRPWLNQVVEGVSYAWTGEKDPEAPSLRDYTPDKVVMVTFDSALRNSFRYGTQVGEEVGVPMTMFMGVGEVLSNTQRYAVHFNEIRGYVESGIWEIQSRLWDAGQSAARDEEGEDLVLPLMNRVWKNDRNRLETLREYQSRIRKEFKGSKEILARESGVPLSEIDSVAYPYGEIGQDSGSNIQLFNVTQVLLNEAEISYKQGFIQSQFGYTMKTDNPLLYKRYVPGRYASGRDVLRQAYLQNPVFMARRMRVEMAALSGQLHMAESNIEMLRRDGYPEEDLAELRAYVQRHLSRLVPLPNNLEDETEGSDDQERKLLSLRSPLIGVDAVSTRANVVIDDQELGIFAGVNLNPRTSLRIRLGAGSIRQTLTTNRFVEVEETTTSSTSSSITTVVDGETSNAQEFRTTTSTFVVESNVVERFKFNADYTRIGLNVNYIHDDGSFTIVRGGLYALDTDGDADFNEAAESDTAITYGLEHQWRPRPAIDFAAIYQHGVVPSSRKLLTYDLMAVRPFWRVRDGWHLNALGSFSYYEDRNSLIRVELENFWRLSQALDIWVGVHNSVDTMDLENDLYWSPYMEQRHYLVFRMRRSYPNYFGLFKINLGYQKAKARDSELDAFLSAQAQGEAEGFSAGAGPDEDWNPLIGFSASATRTWDSGWELSGEFTVNNTKEYTEHSIRGSLLYKF